MKHYYAMASVGGYAPSWVAESKPYVTRKAAKRAGERLKGKHPHCTVGLWVVVGGSGDNDGQLLGICQPNLEWRL